MVSPIARRSSMLRTVLITPVLLSQNSVLGTLFLSTVLGTLSRFIIRDNVPNTETLYILVGIISQEIKNI